MERAVNSFRLSRMGRERDSSGNATNRTADDVWSEIKSWDCDEDGNDDGVGMLLGESLLEDFARCSWGVAVAIIGDEDRDDEVVEDGGGGLLRWEVLVSDGCVHVVSDGLNAEVHADPSSRQNTVMQVVVVVIERCILQCLCIVEARRY